jgi:formylglycine-generating enzyme required for sulfatase activity
MRAALLVTGMLLASCTLGGCGDRGPTARVASRERAAAAASFLAGWADAIGVEADVATGYPRRIRRAKDGGEMVLIPAGTFLLGAVPSDADARDDERPRHAVTLARAYYLDVTEVTVAQWKRFVDDDGVLPERRSRNLAERADAEPVEPVTWYEAVAFATWAGVALPTEAQWERAAKGGHDEFVYPWGTADDAKRRNGSGRADGFPGRAPVRSFPANDYGLYDLSGNVAEWCADAYAKGGFGASPPVDAAPRQDDPSRVLRGGEWLDDPADLRVSRRDHSIATHAGAGFRCAKSLPGP